VDERFQIAADRMSHPFVMMCVMDNHTIRRHLDDVETQLRKAKRACGSGSEFERYIKRALSALDDPQRIVR
jgi:hypothetical protein